MGLGGGINNWGTTTVVGCTIIENTSRNSGGGVSNKDGALTLTGGIASGNTAESQGGGVAKRGGARHFSLAPLSDGYTYGFSPSRHTRRIPLRRCIRPRRAAEVAGTYISRRAKRGVAAAGPVKSANGGGST
mgnify:CR=1 FL=1